MAKASSVIEEFASFIGEVPVIHMNFARAIGEALAEGSNCNDIH